MEIDATSAFADGKEFTGAVELAELLADGAGHRITGDLTRECIEHRADLLVSRRFPGGFDLVSVATPVDFRPDKVTRLVATVAGGPHSLLAAEMAAHLGQTLEVEAEMVSAAPYSNSSDLALSVLDQLGSELPGLSRRVVQVGGVGELVDSLDEGAVIVVGAPGGSWLQRAMFGPGARLRRTA